MALGQIALICEDGGVVVGQSLPDRPGMLEGRLGLLRPVGGLVDNTQIVVALGQVVLICEDGGVVVGQSLPDRPGMLDGRHGLLRPVGGAVQKA